MGAVKGNRLKFIRLQGIRKIYNETFYTTVILKEAK
jgi:hypothetical protein